MKIMVTITTIITAITTRTIRIEVTKGAGEYEIMVHAIKELLIEKGVITSADIRKTLEFMDTREHHGRHHAAVERDTPRSMHGFDGATEANRRSPGRCLSQGF